MASSGGRKCPAGEIQVYERQLREHLCRVLDEAATTHHAIAELALNDGRMHVITILALIFSELPRVQSRDQHGFDTASNMNENIIDQTNRRVLASRPQNKGIIMAKNAKRREWTKDDVRELKTLARQKTPVAKIAKSLKRTPGATQQKAFSLGVSLDTRG